MTTPVSVLDSAVSVQGKLESVLNQFIDQLKLPLNKFDSESTENASSMPYTGVSSESTYRVTFNFGFGYDDEYFSIDEFERWSNLERSKNKLPELK
jgi:hypothetical protein